MDPSTYNTDQNARPSIAPDMRPAMSKIWMKDSSGYPSVTITFLFVSFWITTIAYVLSIVSKIGPVDIRPFDVGACGAYFGIIFSAYIARRYTDARWGNPNISSQTSQTTVVVAPQPSPGSVVVTPPVDPLGAQPGNLNAIQE
jgi:hypothetical protein